MGFIDSWVIEITETDSDLSWKGIKSDFGSLIVLSGCYPLWRERGFLFCAIHQCIIWAIFIIHVIQFSVTVYLLKDDIALASQAVHVLSIILIAMSMLYSFLKYRSSFNYAYKMITENFLYDDIDNSEWGDLLKRTATLKKIATVITFIYIFIMGILNVLVTPIIEYLTSYEKPDFINGVNMKLCVSLWTVYSSENVFGFYFSDLLLLMIAWVLCGVVITGILTYLLIMQEIVFHLKVLIYCALNLEKRAINRFHKTYDHLSYKKKQHYFSNQFFQDCYYLGFRKTAMYHQFIIRLVEHFQKVTSNSVIFSVTNASILIAMSLYGLLAKSVSFAFCVQSFFFLVCEILISAAVCWYGKEISHLSVEFGYLIYSDTKWFLCSKKIKQAMLILKRRAAIALIPINSVIKFDINLETFGNIMNAAYSYINLLFATRN